jgi:hypothetical protein
LQTVSGFENICNSTIVKINSVAGAYILENTPPPPWGRGKISAEVIWGKKYEKVMRKRGKI